MLLPYAFRKNIFDEVFDSAFNHSHQNGMMSTDIKETDEGYELIIDLPGVQKQDISAELKNGYLSISATIDHSSDDSQNEKYLRRERVSGSYRRSFYVGESLQQEDIRAKFENGALHLLLPKEKPADQVETKNLIAIEG